MNPLDLKMKIIDTLELFINDRNSVHHKPRTLYLFDKFGRSVEKFTISYEIVKKLHTHKNSLGDPRVKHVYGKHFFNFTVNPFNLNGKQGVLIKKTDPNATRHIFVESMFTRIEKGVIGKNSKKKDTLKIYFDCLLPYSDGTSRYPEEVEEPN